MWNEKGIFKAYSEWVHTYIHAYIHACMHAFIHTYIHIYLNDHSPLGLFRANETNNWNELNRLRIPTGWRQTSWLCTSAAEELKNRCYHVANLTTHHCTMDFPMGPMPSAGYRSLPQGHGVDIHFCMWTNTLMRNEWQRLHWCRTKG